MQPYFPVTILKSEFDSVGHWSMNEVYIDLDKYDLHRTRFSENHTKIKKCLFKKVLMNSSYSRQSRIDFTYMIVSDEIIYKSMISHLIWLLVWNGLSLRWNKSCNKCVLSQSIVPAHRHISPGAFHRHYGNGFSWTLSWAWLIVTAILA